MRLLNTLYNNNSNNPYCKQFFQINASIMIKYLLATYYEKLLLDFFEGY